MLGRGYWRGMPRSGGITDFARGSIRLDIETGCENGSQDEQPFSLVARIAKLMFS